MKKASNKFWTRMRILGGILLAIIVVMVVSCAPDFLSGIAHVSIATAGILGGVVLSGKSIIELQELRGETFQKLEDILKACETEKRDLNDAEVTKRDEILQALDKIDKEIRMKEDIDKKRKEYAGKQFKKEGETKEQRELASYSFVKAIREFTDKELTGLEKEMHEEARNESKVLGNTIVGLGIPSKVLQRDLTATGQTSVAGDQGGLTIQTTKKGFIDSLKARMVFQQLGATYLTGLTQGNLSIPKLTADTSPDWVATENVAAAASQPLFGSVDLNPKRLTTYLNVSNQLIRQSSLDVESIVINNIQKKLMLKLEAAAINGTGATGIPKGILNVSGIGSVAGGANGAAPTYQNLIDLESALANANADLGSMAYLGNAKVRGKLKSTLKVAGYPNYLWDGGEFPINGYKAAVTNNVPSNLTKGSSGAVCSALIFANWAELIIAQWGGLDLVIDPYSMAKNNEIVLTVHSFWDIAVNHPESFAAMVDMLTT